MGYYKLYIEKVDKFVMIKNETVMSLCGYKEEERNEWKRKKKDWLPSL